MTFLILAISSNYYALPAKLVHEVVPNLIEYQNQKNEKHNYLAGAINFRGKRVPVIDLCLVHIDRPAHQLLSSRIILINYQLPNNESRIIGLLAEKVTETVQLNDVREEGETFSNHTFQIDRSINSSIDEIQPFVINKMVPDNLSEIFLKV